MVLSPPTASPVTAIDTRSTPLHKDSQGTKPHPVHCGPGSTMASASSTTGTTLVKPDVDCSFKSSVIPEHSSLPSPLSPPLSVSPPSFGPAMSDFIVSRAAASALPPHLAPSPIIDQLPSQGSPISSPQSFNAQAEAWLAHAAAQRRHLHTSSISSTTSSPSALFSPDSLTSQPPAGFEFGESERVQEDSDDELNGQEPQLNINMRPSELRASLMALARRSSAKLQKKKRSFEGSSRLSGLSNQSLGSPNDSQASARSSVSSSVGGWAPRERSLSVSSQASNDSVNLDALIASGSDINEECPLDLDDDDDGEYQQQPYEDEFQLQQQPYEEELQLQQQQPQQHPFDLEQQQQPSQDLQQQQLPQQPELQQQEQQPQQQQPQTAPSQGPTGIINNRRRSLTDTHLSRLDENAFNRFWGDSEQGPKTAEDAEFDSALKEFSRLQLRSPTSGVRGLRFSADRREGSPRFSESSRNPYDLEADFMEADMPAGLRTLSRSSTLSDGTSNRTTSRLPPRFPGSTTPSGLKSPSASGLKSPAPSGLKSPAPSGLRSPAPSGLKSPAPSGLKSPATRLTQPATRSGLTPPKAGAPSPRTAIGRPSGLQTPKTGAPAAGKSGLQPPKTGAISRTGSIPKAGTTPKTGIAAPRTGLTTPKAGAAPRTGTTPRATGLAKPGTIASPSRTSTMDQKRGATTSRLPSSTPTPARTPTKSQLAQPSGLKKPTTLTPGRQSLMPGPGSSGAGRTTPNLGGSTRNRRSLTSPTMEDRYFSGSSSSYMVSPTSSTSSLHSLTPSSDSVASLSHRLSQATGTSQLARSKVGAAGRTLSVYGHDNDVEDDDGYGGSVLTPPQSPSSSKIGSRMTTGSLRRPGIAAPSRLMGPSTSSRSSRSTSPSPLSAGSNSGSMSLLPRPHTPTSSRIPSGLASPRAGRY